MAEPDLGDRISAERLDHSLSGKPHVNLCPLLDEDGLVVDHTAAEKTLENDISATDFNVKLKDTFLDDVDIFDFVAWFHETVASIHLRRGLTVDDFVQNWVFVLKVAEVRQLLEGHLDEPHVFVLVLEDALLDILEDRRVLQDDFVEVLQCKLANGAVLKSDDGGSGRTLVDEGNLAEKLSLTKEFQFQLRSLFLFRVSNDAAHFLSFAEELGGVLNVKVAEAEIDEALTLGDQVKTLGRLQFLDDHVIGLHKFGRHLRDDRSDEELFGLV